jgi:hypothetical protein
MEHEQRFLPTSAQLDAFVDALTMGPLPKDNKRPRAATTIWTTYLDTDDGVCFLSCEGPTARRLRIREYQTPDGGGLPSPCYLELKETTGGGRSKLRITAPIATLARLIDGAEDLADSTMEPAGVKLALGAIRQVLAHGHFAPCVGTSYQRRCLASSHELRVTLDEDLAFFYPASLGPPHDNGELLALGPSRVLEVKYAASLPDWLARACEGLTEAPGFSKFHLGMLAVKRAGAIAAGPIRNEQQLIKGVPCATPHDIASFHSESSSRPSSIRQRV